MCQHKWMRGTEHNTGIIGRLLSISGVTWLPPVLVPQVVVLFLVHILWDSLTMGFIVHI